MGWEVAHTICLLGYNHSLNFRHNYSCYNYVMLESIDVNSKIYMYVPGDNIIIERATHLTS